jgi:hypothetical protein
LNQVVGALEDKATLSLAAVTLLIPSSILGGASRDESAGISDGGYRPEGNPLHEHKGKAQPLKNTNSRIRQQPISNVGSGVIITSRGEHEIP